MFDKLLSILAPHHCYECGKIGVLLCESCKYNIINDRERFCIVCQKPTNRDGVCSHCKPSYEKAFYGGTREGVIARLVDDYKFNRVFAGRFVCSEILDAVVPLLPPSTIIVPVPTIRAHIRQRGYDQVLGFTKEFARKRNLQVKQLLERKTTTVQRGASAKQRREQAKHAFVCREKLDSECTYLLVDDVFTTGATIEFAAQTLRAAGAENIWVAVVARQTLD